MNEARAGLAPHEGEWVRLRATVDVGGATASGYLRLALRNLEFAPPNSGWAADHTWIKRNYTVERAKLTLNQRIEFEAVVGTFTRRDGTTDHNLRQVRDIVVVGEVTGEADGKRGYEERQRLKGERT